MTDLSAVTKKLAYLYSHRGPQPRDPASMMRAYLIYLLTHPKMSITEWVDLLHRVPLYTILSGFPPDDVPGVGTFYDFFARLWGSCAKNQKPRKQRRKRKAKKGQKKGEKAPTASPGRVQRLVRWMLRRFHRQVVLPSDQLFHLFQDSFLTVSANLGLLGDVRRLSLVGERPPIPEVRLHVIVVPAV